VLGREVCARRFLDVGVDLARPDLEETVAAPALERRDDRVHVGIDDRLQAALAALGRVVEDERAVARELDVVLRQRREPVAAVAVGVLLAADAEEAAVEQSHRARELAPPSPLAQVACSDLAKPRQRAREREHLVELLLVAPLPPALVVPVLTAARSIRADGLQMPIRVGADPDVLPCRRDRERADALERLGVVDASAGGVDVNESPPAPAADDPRE